MDDRAWTVVMPAAPRHRRWPVWALAGVVVAESALILAVGLAIRRFL